MQAIVRLQDPSIHLLEGRATLHQLTVLRVRQHPVSMLRDNRHNDGWGRGGVQSVVTRRAAPLLAEAAQKTKTELKAKTPKKAEKFDGPVEGKGG